MNFYNLYIEDNTGEKTYKIALDDNQINLLVNAFLNGEKFIRIKGSKLNIENPRKLIIYSITSNSLGGTQESIESNLNKEKGIIGRGKMSLFIYGLYGTNVTDKFLKGCDWGNRKNENPTHINQPNHLRNKFFISHSSKDSALVELFINHILKLGLGLRNNEIFCTSIDGTGIKSGEDFKDRIKNELLKCKVVIQIMSPQYKQSEICLNEMGAAWVLCETIIPIVIPPLNYDVGFLHSNTQQLKLNNRVDLLKFYEDHRNKLFNNEVSLVNYNRQIDTFLGYLETHLSVLSNQEAVFFYDDKIQIDGLLKEGIHSWPPQENINEPEQLSYARYFYIELNSPISVLSNVMALEKNSFDMSRFNISRIQITASDEIYKNFKSLLNKKIKITGEFFGEHTVWHRTPVLISADSIVLT